MSDEGPLMLCPLWEKCYGAVCYHNRPHKKITADDSLKCDTGWCWRIPRDVGCVEVTDELLVYYTMRSAILKEEWIRDIKSMAQKHRIS
jgi:hypothetical protein